MNNCTITRAVDERTFVCIEEAPSLWPPGTVCQRGTWAWAQSNASSWHCAYDTSNTLNYVQLTVMHVLICFGFCMFTCVLFVYIAVLLSWTFVLPLLWHNASRLDWTVRKTGSFFCSLMFYFFNRLVLISVQHPPLTYNIKSSGNALLFSIKLDIYSKG